MEDEKVAGPSKSTEPQPGLRPRIAGTNEFELMPTIEGEEAPEETEASRAAKRRRMTAPATAVVPTAEEEEIMGETFEEALENRPITIEEYVRAARQRLQQWADGGVSDEQIKREAREHREAAAAAESAPEPGCIPRAAEPGDVVPPAEDEDEGGDRQEGRRVRTKPDVYTPTLAEWKEHRLTHLPFRNWCPDCVAGKSVDDPHRRREPIENDGTPEVHMDYCFLRNRAGDEPAKVVVGKERKTRCFFAHVVPRKGASVAWVPKQLAKDVKKVGCRGRLIIRTDGEAAIKDLASEVARARGDLPTVLETPPPSDSRANGYAERAVRSLEEQVRVLKTAFQGATKKELDVLSPGMAWLVEHSADTLNKGLVGPDGRTAHERVRGRRYHGELFEFGQVILSKIPGKPVGGVVQPRWIKGIWLGKLWSSDEHIVSAPGGRVVRSRTCKPHADLWDWGLCDEIVGWPSDPSGTWSGEPGVQSEAPRLPPRREPPPVAEPPTRRVMITTADIDRYGSTEGCRRCRAITRGELVEGKTSVAHSEECRRRIEERIRQDPEQKHRVEAAEERRDKYLAREVERDRTPVTAPPPTEEPRAQPAAAPPPVAPEAGSDGDEDGLGLPEVGEEEPDQKRQRVESASRSRAPSAADEDEPLPKRPREVMLSWADLADEESGEEQKKRSRGGNKVCRSCGSKFWSRNELFRHLQQSKCGTTGPFGSTPDGRRSTEDGGPVHPRKVEDGIEARVDHSETHSLQSRLNGSEFDICEIFSPPRVCAAAKAAGMRAGWSLDMTEECPVTGRKWDFRRPGDRRQAKNLVLKGKPEMLILSPPCTLFSSLQRWSRYGPPEVRRPDDWEEAVGFVDFCVDLCEVQNRGGRGFCFEHPRYASSWELPSMARLRAMPGVGPAELDMCQFGMVSRDEKGEAPCRKATRLLTNVVSMRDWMSRTCQGGHRHVQLVSGRSKAAAIYPPRFCKAIVEATDMAACDEKGSGRALDGI